MIKAHGVEYLTLPQVAARIAKLAYKNALHGPSDGRVTELEAIFVALDDATGSADATVQLLANAEYLGKFKAPILAIDRETDIVRWNVTEDHGTFAGASKIVGAL